jgi:hypothetical protein
MDFRPNPQPNSSRPTPVAPAVVVTNKKETQNPRMGGILSSGRWIQILSLVIVTGVAILLASVALAIGRGSNTNESQYISSSKYQAVFLNNGQVYFGKILNLNSQYVRMSGIYYLTQGTTTDGKTSSSYSLVKLGCQQIHDPTDQMVINRSQVTFWENIESSGKVATSIQQFQKQNPKGPDCTQVSNQTQASDTSTSAQGGSAASTTGTSTSTTPTTGTSDTTKK